MEDLRLHGLIGGGGGSNIKSIQKGITDITGRDKEKEITISPIDVTKSVIRILGKWSSGNLTYRPSMHIINSTTLKMERYDASSSFPCAVAWEVIEFENVKSLQSGFFTTNINGYEASYILPIDTVDLSKSMLFYDWHSTHTTSTLAATSFTGNIISPTEVEFRPPDNTYDQIVFWFVVEFN